MTEDIVERLQESLTMIHPDPQDVRDAITEIERLRECLQHAIDHAGKWQLFTAEEKQTILAEYEKAVRGE